MDNWMSLNSTTGWVSGIMAWTWTNWSTYRHRDMINSNLKLCRGISLGPVDRLTSTAEVKASIGLQSSTKTVEDAPSPPVGGRTGRPLDKLGWRWSGDLHYISPNFKSYSITSISNRALIKIPIKSKLCYHDFSVSFLLVAVKSQFVAVLCISTHIFIYI